MPSKMAQVRRFEYKEGSSNKFYEISVVNENGWKVKTKWGRIGALGQMQEIPCPSEWRAKQVANQKIYQKTRKGYQEVTGGKKYRQPGSPPEVMELKESDKIRMPTHWAKFKSELLPGEIAIYEKYEDPRTSARRKALAQRYKELVLDKAEDEDVQKVREAAWLLLRFTYLQYLVQVSTYKPAAHELARATVTALKKKLIELPDNQKAAVDKGLKNFTTKSGPLSLAECDQGVNSFVDMMSHEIKERKKIGLGGISRKRARILARKKKLEEKE